MANKIKLQSIEIIKVLEHLDYKVFYTGFYNINIIGVRKNTNVPNKFDDEIHVIYIDENNVVIHEIYQATTDAGLYWLENPSRITGTAILVPNQYRGAWKIDLHRGKYEALCQRKMVEVYRDSNRDRRLDFDPQTIEKGYFGINIHRANSSWESTEVNKWSAGCQVIANPKSFNRFMDIVNKSKEIYGNSFTYTLIREQDIINYRKNNE